MHPVKESQSVIDYQRIAQAIAFIRQHFRQQPSLNEIAAAVHLSPLHFQRLFTDWAGASPKKFLQYISIGHAKKMLEQKQATLFDTALDTGLSGTSRLHDLFINIEGMTPAEYRDGGRNLSIHYDISESPFGNIIVASTSKGICHLAFIEEETLAIGNLKSKFPNAAIQRKTDELQQQALSIFRSDWTNLPEIKLHLKGTEFQLKVWECLLTIPVGKLSTYQNIAQKIEKPKASRAVGTAIGSNPVAFLIPCHRVIQATGQTGGYRWGPDRKTAIIGWEAAKTDLPG